MHYNVYVIQLDNQVKTFKRFLAANPDINPEYPCFYVGQTHLTPEERFAKHKSGKKAGKYVFRYGLWLVPAMYDHVNPIESRERAEEIEEHLTNYLRRHGYGVWSN
jgi:predicted GIY-YIG superfamily endonuclease